jgi:phage terminase large subunit-like protein
VPYNIYLQRGLLYPSGENIIDYNDVYNWYRELVEKYEIYPLKIGYDRYSSQYVCAQLSQYGFHLDDVFQGYNLHPVIQEMEGLLKDGKIHIGDNDLLKIHLFNSAVKVSTEKGKSKLIKIKPTAHIDGTAALLDALTVRQKWYSEIGGQLKNERK